VIPLKNSTSIIAIIGATLAVLTTISILVASFFLLQETYPLTFEDTDGFPVDGEVYLNDESLGKTFNGKLFIKEFMVGELKFKTNKDGVEYENLFSITSSDKEYELIFEVDYSEPFSSNPVIQSSDEYSDYLAAIVLNDAKLRQEATTAAKDCPSGDKECQLISVYEYFLVEYKYFGDARDTEHIQSPSETKRFKGGDCEDLTILLTSLLENIGIETYLVFTEDHVYSLACDVDPELIYGYTLTLFETTGLVDDFNKKISLEGGEGWYYGGDETFDENLLTISASIESKLPLIIFAVNNGKEFDAFIDDEEYFVVEDTYYADVLSKKIQYEVPNRGGIVIYNPNYQTVLVDLALEAYSTYLGIDPSELEITSYTMNNKICVPLDPAAGEYSYVGYEDDNLQEKTIINTFTREEYVST